MIRLKGKIVGGKFQPFPNYAEITKREFSKWEGERVDVVISKESSKRSIAQNNYWHGVLVAYIRDFFRELGYDVDSQDVHEYLKQHYLGYKLVEIDGKTLKVPNSSRDLTKEKFIEVKERIQRDFAFRGLVIPDPNQKNFL